ncbi:MAG: LysR family transcriptional regulator [Propionibacteriaceae bacterium]|jgi:DNA-binding transcriptional LysR family regulator|nr:LysR family transcriptional regulator [Propionibacteriaceae bacterium]
MGLDPRRLLIFRTVLAAGSVSAGARDLGWSQPAVTQQLQALERATGVQLLIRGPRGVVATEAGRVLLGHADAISDRLAAATAELEAFRDSALTTVRLAAFSSAMSTLVSRALELLRVGAPPPPRVRLLRGSHTQVKQMLQDDQADLGIVFDFDREDEFEHTTLYVDPVYLVIPASHPLARQRTPRLSDFADMEWATACSRSRAYLEAVARRAGFEPAICCETDDAVLLQTLVGGGMAVAALPKTSLTAYRSTAIAVRESSELSEISVDVIRQHGTQVTAPVIQVLHALQEATYVGPTVDVTTPYDE